MNLGIIGSGGFGRETLLLAKDILKNKNTSFDKIFFIEFDNQFKRKLVDNTTVLKLSEVDFSKFLFVIAIGNNKIREKIDNELNNKVEYTSLISPRSYISDDMNSKEGLIVMPYCYITCNVALGKHTQINSSCSIGHDTQIGNYFTAVSGTRIAGSNTILNNVYFSANSSTKQGVEICSDVKIGLNSSVVKNIVKSGTYFGNPAKFLI